MWPYCLMWCTKYVTTLIPYPVTVYDKEVKCKYIDIGDREV